MPIRIEPASKRVIAFVDGQNLTYAIKEGFYKSYPDFDPKLLAELVCSRHKDWTLSRIQFYTGVHTEKGNSFWHTFWTKKLLGMARKGIGTFSKPLHYRTKTVRLRDGSAEDLFVGQEKGVDIRIALDVIRAVRLNECDVVLLFSQDTDFAELAIEIKSLSSAEGRWIKICSAFPIGPGTENKRGIPNTDWELIFHEDYQKCLDPNDYRVKLPDSGVSLFPDD